MPLRSVCPLNCPDSCTLIVEPIDGELKVRGERNTVTQGFICSKGLAYTNRSLSPDRLHFPLLKENGVFKRIAWDDAYELFIRKLGEALAETGPLGILHHYDYAHNGVLRELDRRFFQSLGGSTEPRGSMCWGAGYQAQKEDFGAVYSSQWDDLSHAKVIVLWGRDPALTNLHLMPHIVSARKAGAEVIVINPIRIKSGDFADQFVQVKPGTDQFLALGIAHAILKERWHDSSFVHDYTEGFEEYAHLTGEFPLEKVEQITGVGQDIIKQLARKFAHQRPVTFVVGYGLQRYVYGGDAVRAIDALAALTGNIGVSGAGVQYAHQYHSQHLNSVLLEEGRYQSRTFPHATLAQDLQNSDIPIKVAVVTRSNPLVQQPDSSRWQEFWSQIPFKVTFDIRMSETARQSDLVLPIATILEEEELVATSWSPLLQYVEPILKPQGQAKPEPLIFIELAQRMGLKSFPYQTLREWINYVIAPLKEYGITLDELKKGPILPVYFPAVAWSNKDFKTPSGKFQMLTQVSEDSLSSSVKAYPWSLLTPHPGQSIHSQFMDDEYFRIWIHPELAQQRHLREGDWAAVETEVGQLKGRVTLSDDIHPQAVVIPEGAVVDGLGVNRLIEGKLSTMGESTSYYDTKCEIRKWLVD